MNTLTTKFSILILILAITIGSQAKAEKDSVCTDNKNTAHLIIHAPLTIFISEILDLIEDFQAEKLEDWMFADLITEEEAQPLEDWMFEELIPEEEESVLEDWMFDTDYFDDNVTIKDWMLDTEYYSYKG